MKYLVFIKEHPTDVFLLIFMSLGYGIFDMMTIPLLWNIDYTSTSMIENGLVLTSAGVIGLLTYTILGMWEEFVRKMIQFA